MRPMSAVSFDGLLIISVIAVAAPVLSATVNTATALSDLWS
jgi:hypothetical protein